MQFARGAIWCFFAPEGASRLDVLSGGHVLGGDVADGAVNFQASETALVPLGPARSQWSFSDGRVEEGDRFEVVSAIRVDGAGAGLATTHAERMVGALERALNTMAGSADVSFTVDGSSYTFQTRAEMRIELARWQREVRRDRGEVFGKRLVT